MINLSNFRFSQTLLTIMKEAGTFASFSFDGVTLEISLDLADFGLDRISLFSSLFSMSELLGELDISASDAKCFFGDFSLKIFRCFSLESGLLGSI